MQTIEPLDPSTCLGNHAAKCAVVHVHRQFGFQPKCVEAIPLEYCQGGAEDPIASSTIVRGTGVLLVDDDVTEIDRRKS